MSRRRGAGLVLAGALVGLSACTGSSPADGAAGTASSGTAGSTSSGSAGSPGASAGGTATGPRQLTVVAGGDVLLHEPTWTQADANDGVVGDGLLDFAPMLAAIEPIVSGADLALCHLETPLAPPGGPYAGYPSFSVPPQIVPALKATGFDACSGASNHTFDQGLVGVERTATLMRDGGVPTYGTGVNGAPPNPSYVMVGDVRVGLLSYAYGSNGAVPQAGVVENLDPADIAADARTARDAGADIVIASVHWGTEYDHDPNDQQLEVADALAADPDIDLVIGCHAHVVQPIERVLPTSGEPGQPGGTWVAYGLGNMIAAQSTDVPDNREGVLARFTFTLLDGDWSVTEAAYLPLYVTRDPAVRIVLPSEVEAPTEREAEALTRTRKVVHDGAASEDLVEIGAS